MEGRVGKLIAIVAILLLIAAIYGLVVLISRLHDNRYQRRDAMLTRSVAGKAPGLLANNPLTQTVVQQGKFLEEADELFHYMLRSDIDVMLPEAKKAEIRAWQANYDKSRE